MIYKMPEGPLCIARLAPSWDATRHRLARNVSLLCEAGIMPQPQTKWLDLPSEGFYGGADVTGQEARRHLCVWGSERALAVDIFADLSTDWK